MIVYNFSIKYRKNYSHFVSFLVFPLLELKSNVFFVNTSHENCDILLNLVHLKLLGVRYEIKILKTILTKLEHGIKKETKLFQKTTTKKQLTTVRRRECKW